MLEPPKQILIKLIIFFYRGLRICDANYVAKSKTQLCNDSNIITLEKRRNVLLLFMHKQCDKVELLKHSNVRTRLHKAPVFNTYKPDNEKACQNIFYRGANVWNKLPSCDRNSDFKDFK